MLLQGKPVAAMPLCSAGARQGTSAALGPLAQTVRPANRSSAAGRASAMTPHRP
jgi:hypothetical protein